MIVNLNVKIKAGPRTPIEVTVYSTSVNDKTIKFANGKSVGEQAIADWIQENLTVALKEIAEENNA